MADTTVKILDIQLKYKDAIEQLAQYRKGLDEATAEQKKLKEELKSGTISQDDYNKKMEATRQYVNQQRTAVNTLTRQFQAQLAAEKQETGSLNQLKAQLSSARVAYDALSRSERNGAKGKEMRKHIKEITGELKKAEGQIGVFSRNVGNYGASMKGMFTAAAAGVAAVIAAVKTFANAYKTIAEFEQANKNLQTILQATDEEMESLTQTALNLGRSTEYTASQVTGLQTELAKLGFSIPEIKNMQASVLALATDLDADLSRAAALTGATLRSFGADSSEAAHYVDVLVKGAYSSAASFSKYETSLAQLSPVMNAYGMSIEDTVALLGTLYDAGFDASMAATSTRNIMLNLADSSSDLSKRLKEPVKDIPSLVKGLKQLQAEGTDLNEALELSDKRSVAAFSRFLDGADAIQTLRDKLDDVDGMAIEVRSERLETVQGQVKMLSSAWEGLVLTMRDSTGVISGIIGSLADAINGITDRLDPEGAYARKLEERTKHEQEGLEAEMKAYIEHGASVEEAIKKSGENQISLYVDKEVELKKAMEKARGRKKKELEQQIADYAMYRQAVHDAMDAEVELWNNKSEDPTPEQKAQEVEERRKENEKASKAAAAARKAERDAVRKAQDALLAIIVDEGEKERQQITLKYDREIEDLKEKLNTEKNLTAKARDAIVKLIELKEAERQRAVDALSDSALKREIEKRTKAITVELEAVRKGSEEEMALKKEQNALLQQQEIDEAEATARKKKSMLDASLSEGLISQAEYEEQQTELTQDAEDAKSNIIAKYNAKNLQLDADYQRSMLQQQQRAIAERFNNLINSRENELREIEISNEENLANDASTLTEQIKQRQAATMAKLEAQRQEAEQMLSAIEQAGKIEGETQEEYNVRRIAAENELQATLLDIREQEVANARETERANAEILESRYEASEKITGALVELTETLGEENKGFAKLSKVLALAEIAFNTGKAIAEGTASAMSQPYPANLVAVATTVATVLSNIATAISTVKSAKFARGGKVEGPGTGTSDSIPARLSNGEYVVNAKATRLYEPLLNAMNNIGGGIPMQVAGSAFSIDSADMMAESFSRAASKIRPVVSVKEITSQQNRVRIINDLDGFRK